MTLQECELHNSCLCSCARYHDCLIYDRCTYCYALHHHCHDCRCTNDNLCQWQQLVCLPFDQVPRCNCVRLFIGTTRSTIQIGCRSRGVFLFGLCGKWSNLLIEFCLHFSQFCCKSNHLILFANFTLPSTIFKHVVVCLDYLSTNIWAFHLSGFPQRYLLQRMLTSALKLFTSIVSNASR